MQREFIINFIYLKYKLRSSLRISSICMIDVITSFFRHFLFEMYIYIYKTFWCQLLALTFPKFFRHCLPWASLMHVLLHRLVAVFPLPVFLVVVVSKKLYFSTFSVCWFRCISCSAPLIYFDSIAQYRQIPCVCVFFFTYPTYVKKM